MKSGLLLKGGLNQDSSRAAGVVGSPILYSRVRKTQSYEYLITLIQPLQFPAYSPFATIPDVCDVEDKVEGVVKVLEDIELGVVAIIKELCLRQKSLLVQMELAQQRSRLSGCHNVQSRLSDRNSTKYTLRRCRLRLEEFRTEQCGAHAGGDQVGSVQPPI